MTGSSDLIFTANSSGPGPMDSLKPQLDDWEAWPNTDLTQNPSPQLKGTYLSRL